MKELWDAVQWLWRNTTGGLRLVLIIVVCLVGLAWLALANSDKWKVIFKPIADARRRNKYKFLKDSLGILVLRIVADDKRDSLQAKLIAELNNALDDQSNIQVRGYKLVVDESIGLVQAHKLARDIGEKFNAFLVIWGNRAGGLFYPRVTFVRKTDEEGLKIKHILGEKMIDDIGVFRGFIEMPIFLAHLALGFTHYAHEHFRHALDQFERALARESIPPEEVTKVRIYIANCLWNLATPPDTEGLFNKAIDYAKQAAAEYESRNENQEWAWTLNYLASGFRDLPTGDRRRNLQAAIEYNTKALAVYDVSTSPLKWADTQEVLGDTYGQMPTENRAENLREARDHYNKALEIYCDPFFPYPEQYRVWDKVKKVENELTKLERR